MVQKKDIKKKTSQSSSSSSFSFSLPKTAEASQDLEEEVEDTSKDLNEEELTLIREGLSGQEVSDNVIDVASSRSSQIATPAQPSSSHSHDESTKSTLLNSSLASVKLHDESNDHLLEANTSNNSHSFQVEPYAVQPEKSVNCWKCLLPKDDHSIHHVAWLMPNWS